MIRIFDAGLKFADRYTIIIGNDVYTMGETPDDPGGFNQWAGLKKDFNIKALGKEITLRDLPKRTLIGIIGRLYE